MIRNQIQARRMRAEAKLERGTYTGNTKSKYLPYYDTSSLLSTKTEHSFFATGLGQGSTVKTLADTNFPQGGRIPSKQNFTIYGFQMLYGFHALIDTATIPLWHAMLMNTSITFGVSNAAPGYQRTLDQLMGCPVLGMVRPTVAGDNYHQLGNGSFQAVDMLSKPIVLEADTGFDLKVIHHTAANAALDGDKLRIVMLGEMTHLVG